MDPRPRYKRLENRRIAQVQLANGEGTLLIKFTDGGTAVVDADIAFLREDPGPTPVLSIEVDGYS